MDNNEDPRKKVTNYTLEQAASWAREHPFNHNPEASVFRNQLVTWMEEEGFFFGSDGDSEKVWNLYREHINIIRKEILEKHKLTEIQKDPSISILFKKHGLFLKGKKKKE